jgi:hypothetical protein
VSLPFTTTTVNIETRTTSDGDRWETPTWMPVQSAVPATVSSPSPSDRSTSQGDQEQIDMVLHVNPGVAVTRLDRVTDLTLGEVYDVLWVTTRIGFGLDHTRAGLRRVVGIGA